MSSLKDIHALLDAAVRAGEALAAATMAAATEGMVL